jgi:hypothetical protein
MSLEYVEGAPEGYELTENKVDLKQSGAEGAGSDGCAVM